MSAEVQVQTYRNKKTKEIYTLHHTTTDQERGFVYSYLEHDGKILAFGAKALKEIFEDVGGAA